MYELLKRPFLYIYSIKRIWNYDDNTLKKKKKKQTLKTRAQSSSSISGKRINPCLDGLQRGIEIQFSPQSAKALCNLSVQFTARANRQGNWKTFAANSKLLLIMPVVLATKGTMNGKRASYSSYEEFQSFLFFFLFFPIHPSSSYHLSTCSSSTETGLFSAYLMHFIKVSFNRDFNRVHVVREDTFASKWDIEIIRN